MAVSSNLQNTSVIGRLIARVKRLAAVNAETFELRRMDDHQVDEIAHGLGLSRLELFAICNNKESGDLLKRRLAQFGLTEESLARKHPDVLHDLQRVCGTCRAASRCAHDFTVCEETRRDEYCPNTCTLYALKQEGLGRKDSSAMHPASMFHSIE
ncbi:hypothetical protein JQ628_26850 [Bradyrhizobium lablabi]|uniref:hypothetical protein n=1 Tax=Bradyrhizobium lablabi TaxID=722472 RepID=UPI001BA58D78|nr:hypothetical protein [Bradyrhizobium lablabi]MBR1125168.1 hypothetical protein [Bradyrhizobium lablabi]